MNDPRSIVLTGTGAGASGALTLSGRAFLEATQQDDRILCLSRFSFHLAIAWRWRAPGRSIEMLRDSCQRTPVVRTDARQLLTSSPGRALAPGRCIEMQRCDIIKPDASGEPGRSIEMLRDSC